MLVWEGKKERKKERVKVTFDHLQASTNVRSYIHFSFLSSTFFLLFFSRIKKNKPNAKNFLSVLCHSERRVVLTDYYYLQLTIKKGTSNWTHYTQRKRSNDSWNSSMSFRSHISKSMKTVSSFFFFIIHIFHEKKRKRKNTGEEEFFIFTDLIFFYLTNSWVIDCTLYTFLFLLYSFLFFGGWGERDEWKRVLLNRSMVCMFESPLFFFFSFFSVLVLYILDAIFFNFIYS